VGGGGRKRGVHPGRSGLWEGGDGDGGSDTDGRLVVDRSGSAGRWGEMKRVEDEGVEVGELGKRERAKKISDGRKKRREEKKGEGRRNEHRRDP